MKKMQIAAALTATAALVLTGCSASGGDNGDAGGKTTIVVDMENFPCRQVADVVAQHHPEPKAGLVASAMHKRGVTAWVEREGIINGGDDIIVWLPPQRIYAHTGS